MVANLAFTLFSVAAFHSGVFAAKICKTTPHRSSWPSEHDWQALNSSIDGRLLKTVPAASSCWSGNPFGSKVSCDAVEDGWGSGLFHIDQPESIDYPLWANNSCLPPTASGYDKKQGCELGGLPEFIVNATQECHVATALKWAAERNIRVSVKGTGHDMSGRYVIDLYSSFQGLLANFCRSTGAYSLSIWTRHFQKLEFHSNWPLPSGGHHDVVIAGSGHGWGEVLTPAMEMGKVVCTGQDGSVGLGGWTTGGGHGPLSGLHGLGSHQVVQLTVVTVRGEILVANAQQNTDIYWALRGGGGGQYGVVTEFVVRTHPAPTEVTSGTISMFPTNSSGSVEASWEAAALLLSELPGIMDKGMAGSASMATGNTIAAFNPAFDGPKDGVAMTQVFYTYGNGSNATFFGLVNPLLNKLNTRFNGSIALNLTASTTPGYKTFYKSISGSNAAGGGSIMSSRLLGKKELVDTPQSDVVSYIKTALTSQSGKGMYLTIGLQGGPIMANMSDERFAATLPAWRSAYLHFMAGGAEPSSDLSPQEQLTASGDWTEANKEAMWRKWAPESGAYMNEANPLNTHFAHDYYGSNYPKLLQIKEKYDPNMTLYVLAGVGTEGWTYDLNSGELCHE